MMVMMVMMVLVVLMVIGPMMIIYSMTCFCFQALMIIDGH
jgi:hypothetical protein